MPFCLPPSPSGSDAVLHPSAFEMPAVEHHAQPGIFDSLSADAFEILANAHHALFEL